MSQVKLNVLAPDSGLPVEISDRDKIKLLDVSSQPEAYWLPRIAALLSRSGLTVAALTVVKVVFTLDTAIYAAGDLLADTQAIAGAFRAAGLTSKLAGVVILDKDDQAAAEMDLVFLADNTSLGTENAAPTISDTNAEKIIATKKIAATDFLDCGGCKVATTMFSPPLDLWALAGTSAFCGLITQGTPTQTASGIVVQFLFRQE